MSPVCTGSRHGSRAPQGQVLASRATLLPRQTAASGARHRAKIRRNNCHHHPKSQPPCHPPQGRVAGGRGGQRWNHHTGVQRRPPRASPSKHTEDGLGGAAPAGRSSGPTSQRCHAQAQAVGPEPRRQERAAGWRDARPQPGVWGLGVCACPLKAAGANPCRPQARGLRGISCSPAPRSRQPDPALLFLCTPQTPLEAESQPQRTQPSAPQSVPQSEGVTELPAAHCLGAVAGAPCPPEPSLAGAGATLGQPGRETERDGLKAEPGAPGQRAARLCHGGCTARPGCASAASP